MDKILNPLTGRMITANGSLHKRLIKEGKLSQMGAKQGKPTSPPAKPTSPPAKTENFSNFYEEMVKVIKNYLIGQDNFKGIKLPPPNSTEHKLARELLENVKTAYTNNPSWSNMKKTLNNTYKQWNEDRLDKNKGSKPVIWGLREVLIKYGYFDKDLVM